MGMFRRIGISVSVGVSGLVLSLLLRAVSFPLPLSLHPKLLGSGGEVPTVCDHCLPPLPGSPVQRVAFVFRP